MAAKKTESRAREYTITGCLLLTELLVVKFGGQVYGYVAAFFFLLVVFELTKHNRNRMRVWGFRVIVGFLLFALTYLFSPIKPLDTKTNAPTPPPQITVTVRYEPGMLPIKVEPKSTIHILVLDPRIDEGMADYSNDDATPKWWPRNPPAKNEQMLGSYYKCTITNYGDKSLIDLNTVFDLTFYSVQEGKGVFSRDSKGSHLTITMPEKDVEDASDAGIRKMAVGDHWKGRTRVISPGPIVKSIRHTAVIEGIPPNKSATVYLINHTRLFVRMKLPTNGNSIVVGDPTKQPMILVRPVMGVLDEFQEYMLQPSTYVWPGMSLAEK